MKSERGNKNFATWRIEVRGLLRLPIFLLLALMVCLFHAGTVAGQATSFESLEEKALNRIKEARGQARQERYSRALGDLRIAVALAKQAEQARLTLALALHNMAEVHRLQGKAADAIKAYRRALSVYTALDHPSAIAITKAQIKAMRSDSAKKRPGNAEVTPSATGRLGRIDQAVERIRKRLSSRKPSPNPTKLKAQATQPSP